MGDPILTDEQVHKYLLDAGNWKVEAAQRHAMDGPSDEISGFLLLALGIRESHVLNINNPAGTDRGCFQISELYHADWLASEPGCKVGSWRVTPGKTALDKGYCPRFTPALVYAEKMLQGKRARAKALGVPVELRLRFAIAAYNAGEGGAYLGWKAGDVDKFTTHGDYSAWVLTHRTKINHVLRARMPNWIVPVPPQ